MISSLGRESTCEFFRITSTIDAPSESTLKPFSPFSPCRTCRQGLLWTSVNLMPVEFPTTVG